MLVADIEIVKAVPPKNDLERIEGIDYCAGWDDKENMGVSCCVVYDSRPRLWRVFLRDNMAALQELIDSRDLIIGHNFLAFDAPVLAGVGVNIPEEKIYDTLVEAWRGAGLAPTFRYPTHIGFGLDKICEVNFGTKKTEDGALAPVMWQRGEYGRVIDYCVNDVEMTRRVVQQILTHGYIRDPRNPKMILPMASPKARVQK